MKKVFGGAAAVLALAGAVVTAVAGATAGVSQKASGTQICVLLPNTGPTVRWGQFDRPSLAKALKAAGVTFTISDAEGDPQKQKSQASACLANGAKVIIIISLDDASSIAIQKAAAARGAKTIDYDRLIVGGSGSLYVSFDGHAVGVLQGKGIVAGLKAKGKYDQHPLVAELNGGATDNNSFLFKGGYDSVLNPLYKEGTFKKGPDEFVPGWDNQNARTIFEQMLVKTGNKIDAVVAANDGFANAVVTALKSHGLKPIPLSGQDATPQGVQNIISGWQTMTVYKQISKEADAAAKAAVELLKSQKPTSNGTVKNQGRNMPAVLIAPISINKSTYPLLFKEHFLKKSDVCVGKFAKLCK